MKKKFIVAITGFLTVLVLVAGYHMTAHPPGNVLAQVAPTLPDEPVFNSPKITDEGIELSWDSSSESAGTEFVLYRRILPHEKLSEYATVPNSGTSKTSFTDANVDPGLRYLYRVAGVNSAGEGPKSDPEKIIVPGERLEAPSGLTGAYTEQGIELTWDAPINAGVTDYWVYRGKFGANGAGVSQYAKVRADSISMTYLDAEVDPDKKYRYRVAGVNATGEGFKSAWLDVRTTSEPEEAEPVPGEPHALQGVSTEEGIALTWSPPLGSAVTEYRVYRGIFLENSGNLDGGMSEYAIVPGGGDPMTYLDTNVDPGERYRYRVAAINDSGEGEKSNWADLSVNRPATGAPTISGTAQVGETVEADTSGISDEDGLDHATFSYQWLRTDGVANLPTGRATGPSYTLAEADEGFFVQVRVSFTDDRGHVEEVTSALTALVEFPNRPATGKPTIGGTLLAGETLAADTSGISDEDGLGNPSFSYQWMRNGAPIAEATESSYTLAAEDAGQAIEVRVSFTDYRGAVETLTSEEVWPNRPATGAPTISGVPRIPGLLTADPSEISDEDGLTGAAQSQEGFTYAWIIGAGDDARIETNWDEQYIMRLADLGHAIRVRVTFSDDRGHAETRTSEPTEPAFIPNISPTGLPEIVGTAVVGRTLTVDASSIEDEDGIPDDSFFYRWLRGDNLEEIPFAVESTYRVQSLDVGQTIRVRVSFRDQGNYLESLVSEPTAAVERAPNRPSTGQPVIGGIARVGKRLTADTSGIGDADGIGDFALTYQWLRDGSPIDGATESSYTLAEADEGSAILVRVSFIDNRGNLEIVASDPTGAVAPANRQATGALELLGMPWVGETLTVDTSEISDEDGMTGTVFNYQWYRGAYVRQMGMYSWLHLESVEGRPSYTLTEADLNKLIRVIVKFRDDRRHGEKLFTETTQEVEPANNRPTGAPAIPRTVQVGNILAASTSGIADPDGLSAATFNFQWLRDGTPIDGATGSSYALVEADEGSAIRVRVSYTDDRGHAETLTSDPTGAVAPANRQATGAPAIYSKPQVGRSLRADTSGIADPDGLADAVFQYQWITNDGTADADIAEATGAFYTPAAADVGKTVKVRVSFTDDEGNPETLTSAPTVAVVMPPLTASYSVPEPHDGQTAFTFTLWFSEEFKLSYLTLRDHAFTVDGGTVTRARRGQKPSNMLWQIHVQPDSAAAVTIVLPATEDCDAEGAICTEDGRKLSTRLEMVVSGPGG